MRSWFQRLWILVLLFISFSFDSCFDGSRFPFSYAYVASGILLGALACPVVTARIPPAKRTLFDKGIAALVAIFVLALLLEVPCFSSFGSSWEPLFSYPPIVHRALLVVEGCCCAFYVVGAPVSGIEEGHKVSLPGGNKSNSFAHLLMLICGSLFVFGFCRLGQFAFAMGSFHPFDAMPGLVRSSASFLLALPVAIVFMVLDSKSCSSQLGRSACNSCLKIALVSLASGRIVWGLISHAYGDVGGMLLMSAPLMCSVCLSDVVLLCCCLALLSKSADATDEPISESKKDACALRDVIDDLAVSHGLTRREAEAVFYCIQGFTSAESALQMDLKPSTVRCYLQRAYKKIGVSDAMELAHCIDERRAIAASSGTAKADKAVADGDIPGPSRQVLRWSLFAVIAVFASPHFDSEIISTWHFNHAAIVGFGLGILLCAEGMFCLKTIKQCAPSGYGRRQYVNWLLAGVLVLLACLQFVAICVLYPVLSSRVDYGTSIVLVGASSCLLSLALSSLYCASACMRSGNCQYEMPVSVPVVVAGAGILLLSQINDIGWAISAVIVSGFFVGTCLVSKRSEPRSPDKVATSKPGEMVEVQKALLFGSAFAVSFVFGERWHATQEPFMELAQLLFLVGTAVLFVWKRRHEIKFKPVLSVLSSVFILLCCLLSGFIWGLQLLLLLLALLLPATSFDCPMNERNLFCLLGCGSGLLVGRLLIDRWSELMNLPLEGLAMQGNPSYISFATPLAAVLLLLIGFAFVFALESLGVPFQKEEALSERRCLFLRSQGLNELEADVLCKTAQGMAAVQIALEAHYSVGYVGAVRVQGYKKLGIHSRSELSRLLDDAIVARE